MYSTIRWTSYKKLRVESKSFFSHLAEEEVFNETISKFQFLQSVIQKKEKVRPVSM